MIGDLYELRIRYHLPDANASVGLGYQQTAGGNDNLTMQSALDFFNTNFLPFFRDCLAADVSIDQLRMDQVSVGDELPGLINFTGTAGGLGAQALPGGGASVISWVTDAPNAKHNGRMYIGGVAESEVNAGNISAALLFAMNDFATEVQNTLATSLPQDAEFELSTISRILNGVPRVPPVGFLVESHVARLPYFSQRRRITKTVGLS